MNLLSKKIFKKQIGVYLKSIRESRSMSQEQFAELIGVHRNYVGSIERGERNISGYMLLRILHSLSISLSDFEKKILSLLGMTQ